MKGNFNLKDEDHDWKDEGEIRHEYPLAQSEYPVKNK